MSETILIVEDDENLAKGLEINLKKEEYSTIKAATEEKAFQIVDHDKPDLILLDLMLSGGNGLDLCRRVRHRGLDMPIIMLTAKTDEIDRVVGLEVGADDYVGKPFSLRELLARIRAHLRRTSKREKKELTRYSFGSIEIDFETHQAKCNGKPLELTSKEVEILKLLIGCRGNVVRRERMLREIWGYQDDTMTRTVDNQILNLRKKIEEDPAHPQYILTIYGVGYKFVG